MDVSLFGLLNKKIFFECLLHMAPLQRSVLLISAIFAHIDNRNCRRTIKKPFPGAISTSRITRKRQIKYLIEIIALLL